MTGKILVIGANGQLGSELTAALRKLYGHDSVIASDIRSRDDDPGFITLDVLDKELLQTIISLAKNLKMRVIAEGIETESQFSVLKNLGCDYGQGFLLAKPQRAEEAEKLIYRHPRWLPSGDLDELRQSDQTANDDRLPVF